MACNESERKRISVKLKAIGIDDRNEIEYLRRENKRFRRELSSKNSEIKRLEMEFTAYRIEKENETKQLRQKYSVKSGEYENLLKSYKQINKRINSKYHNESAKDKQINSLKIDKSGLIRMKKEEQQKYEELLSKYSDLKKINKKYKAKYRKSKHQASYTVDLNNINLESFSSFAAPLEPMTEDNPLEIIDPQLLQYERQRPKKYKPSRKRKSKVRGMSQIVTMKSRKIHNT